MCFRRILLLAPQAEGARALVERAVMMAQRSGATLDVVDVLSRTIPIRGDRSRSKLKAAHRAAIATRDKELADLVEPFRERGVEMTSRALLGRLVPEVVNQIERNGHDLAVVPVSGERGVGEKHLRAVTAQMIRRCPCPVWVMKPTQPQRHGVLVAVNPGSPGDKKGNLSRSLLRLAVCFSRLEGGHLSVLHIWQLLGESQIRRPLVGARPEKFEALLDTAHKRAAVRMKRFLAEFDLESSPYELHLAKEHRPAKAIVDFAAWRQIETVVLGTADRSGLARLLIGNSADEVLRAVECSIVTFKAGRSFPPIEPDEASSVPRNR